MKIFYLLILALILLSVSFLPAQAALFESTCKPELLPGQGGCDWKDFFLMVNEVIKFLIFVIGFPLAALMVAWGGFVILISGGSPEKVTQGKKIIMAAVIGIAIALASYLIIQTVIYLIVPAEQRAEFIPRSLLR
ncbi:MAG: pilin [Candidatus Harrisonbacteria bacterium]|nr:pilin [Candidatus Harrisonbacteria bacterium]